jgi:DNA-directed RNA polymerase specialized sigma24 family protein
MTVDPWTLAEAGQGKKEALARLLAAFYPQVWRMAVNLTGRESLGREVSRDIMRRSLSAAATWEHEESPTRWFRHHTVLASRRAAPKTPPADDVLVAKGPADPAYAAFARAVRGLPQQQREAFLLNHCEDFDLRHLGIAMDCSVEAAGVHLRHATLALQALAGEDFGRFVQELRSAYAASAPDESLALPYAKKLVRRSPWPVLGWLLGWLLLLAIVAGLAYGLWWIWPRLVI